MSHPEICANETELTVHTHTHTEKFGIAWPTVLWGHDPSYQADEEVQHGGAGRVQGVDQRTSVSVSDGDSEKCISTDEGLNFCHSH